MKLAATPANLITLARSLMILVSVVLIIWFPSFGSGIAAAAMISLAFVLDWADGLVARRTTGESPLGSAIDIAGDRIAENLLWLAFAYQRLVTPAIPIIFLVRAFVVDSIRTPAAKRRRKTAYGLVASAAGRIFVSSRAARGFSGFSKAAAFVLLSLALALGSAGGSPPLLVSAAAAVAWVATAFNLLRGVLALYDIF